MSDPAPYATFDERKGRSLARRAGRVLGRSLTGLAAFATVAYTAERSELDRSVERAERWDAVSAAPPRSPNGVVAEISGPLVVGVGDSFMGASREHRNPHSPHSGQNMNDIPHAVADAGGFTPLSVFETSKRSDQILTEQVAKIPANARYVLLSAGSNDVYSRGVKGTPDSYLSISSVVRDCLKASLSKFFEPCEGRAAAAWDNALAGLPERLTPLIQATKQAAPNASILLIAPPDTLTSQPVTEACAGLDPKTVNFLHEYMARFNERLVEVAETNGIAALKANELPSWDGRRACDGNAEGFTREFSWTGALWKWAGTFAADQLAKPPVFWFHPNERGVAATAQGVRSEICSGNVDRANGRPPLGQASPGLC